jgi:hypothetical protein
MTEECNMDIKIEKITVTAKPRVLDKTYNLIPAADLSEEVKNAILEDFPEENFIVEFPEDGGVSVISRSAIDEIQKALILDVSKGRIADHENSVAKWRELVYQWKHYDNTPETMLDEIIDALDEAVCVCNDLIDIIRENEE